jgi:hypothetical protein
MLPSLQHGKRGEARSMPGLSHGDNTLFLYPDYYPGGLLNVTRAGHSGQMGGARCR